MIGKIINDKIYFNGNVYIKLRSINAMRLDFKTPKITFFVNGSTYPIELLFDSHKIAKNEADELANI
jgi:hypothetical protein